MTSKKVLIFTLIFVFVLGIACADEFNTTTTKILGVRNTSNGNMEGVVANLTVQVKQGSGHVFIDTVPLTQIDTQASARLAKEVACETLNYDCRNLDFFYIIRSDSPMIGGPSAGVVLTAATIAALQGVPINQDVFATGTINPAGSIGPVGSVLEKAEAAHNNSAKIFLVPSGEATVNINDTETIDIVKKADEDWNMKVIEVTDIIDAYKYLTGFEIQRKIVSSEDIASQKFDNAMKLLSDNLMKDAQERYDIVEQKIATSTLSFKYLDPIKEKIKTSESTLNDANGYYSSGQYYSASSYAVRSLINTGYIKLLLEYYDSGESSDYVTGQLNKIKEDVNGFEIMFLKDRTVDSIDDIETFAVVIDRIRESEDIINDSTTSISKGDYDSALYLISYAEVRKNTAYYWLTLINEFTGNESIVFNQSNMRPLAQDRIEQSTNYITYAQTLVNNNILTDAEMHLTKAETALEEDKYIFAIFEAAKARAEANLAMEVRAATNSTVSDLLTLYRDSAKLSIKNAEEQGLLPILALSYLEYAKTFEETDPLTSLIYLSYSKEMSKISEDIVKATTGNQLLPEQPVTIAKYYESVVKFNPEAEVTQQLVLFASGLLAGVVVSFFIAEKAFKKR